MYFQSIVSIKPLPLKPTALTKLANEVRINHKFPPLELPPEVTPYHNIPRSLEEIFIDLEQGQSDNITLLEWVYCIDQKQDWDAQNSREQQLNTSRLVWKSALENYPVKQRLCWRLAYYYDGNKKGLARSLVETFPTLADVVGSDDLKVEVLMALKQRNAATAIAQLAKREVVTLRELLMMAQLPPNLHIIQEINEL